MSEAAVSTQQTRGQETGLFDDRVDVDPTISWVAASVVPIALFVTVPLFAFVRRIQQSSRASGAGWTSLAYLIPGF